MSRGNPFICGSKGQGHELQKHCRCGTLHSCECWLLLVWLLFVVVKSADWHCVKHSSSFSEWLRTNTVHCILVDADDKMPRDAERCIHWRRQDSMAAVHRDVAAQRHGSASSDRLSSPASDSVPLLTRQRSTLNVLMSHQCHSGPVFPLQINLPLTLTGD